MIDDFNNKILGGLRDDFGKAQSRVAYSMDLSGVTGPMAGFGAKTSIASPSTGATYDAAPQM